MNRLSPTFVLDLVGQLQANCLSLVEPQLNPRLSLFEFVQLKCSYAQILSMCNITTLLIILKAWTTTRVGV